MSQISVFNKVFAIQSFFDNAAGANAILKQGMNEPVAQKVTEPRVPGRFFGLHPTSQTPVALRPMSVGATSPLILKPGQFIEAEMMNGFEWGLPFGWMGGGFASLVVANGKEAFSGWTTEKVEVLIHRVRIQVQADGTPASRTFAAAWPYRFPFPNGKPTIAVEPTRASLRLRLNNLAAPAEMRILTKSNDDLDIGSDGLTPGTADFTYMDVNFPAAQPGVLAVGFPVVEIVGIPARLGGDIAAVALIDLTGAAAVLTGAFVDILRYGKI